MTLQNIDFSPLWITLQTGLVASAITFYFGLLAARFVTARKGMMKIIWDSLFTLPMVLPPTAAGFLLLYLFSPNRSFGAFLAGTLGIKVVHTRLGLWAAAAVVSFPLMYRGAKSALEQIDESVIDAAKTLGTKERDIFWKIRVPMARTGILSGFILSFARAIGEYGATSMLAGNIYGKTATISQQIALVIQNGDFYQAGFWCLVVVIISFLLLMIVNLLGDRGK